MSQYILAFTATLFVQCQNVPFYVPVFKRVLNTGFCKIAFTMNTIDTESWGDMRNVQGRKITLVHKLRTIKSCKSEGKASHILNGAQFLRIRPRTSGIHSHSGHGI
jgi:hypothetical protein